MFPALLLNRMRHSDRHTEPMPPDHQANCHARLSWYGEPPLAYASYPTLQAPLWSPLTPYHTPQPPPWSPLTHSPSHSRPRPQLSPRRHPPAFVPEPVDMDALLEHNPFRLAEEYGGNMITDRTALNWIEGHRLPSLDEIGLDQYLQLCRAGASSSRNMSNIEAAGQLLSSFGGESGSEQMLRLSRQVE